MTDRNHPRGSKDCLSNPDETSGRPVLEVAGLRYTVGDRQLLAGVDLTVDRGESVAIMGPSGSGKSTLVACILGLIAPDSGSIRVAGSPVSARDKRSMSELRRRHIGVVFQFGELLPELSPLENVALAALLAGREPEDAFTSASILLERLGVSTGATATTMLSGGERQRTAVARALINRPSLILADEPTGALDSATKALVAELLFALPSELDCALLVVTHDKSVVERADDIVELKDGVLGDVSILASS